MKPLSTSPEPRYHSSGLLLCFFLSLLIHVGLVLVLPDLTRLFKIHLNSQALRSEKPIMVDLVKIQVKPLPPPPRPQPEKNPLTNDRIEQLIDRQLADLPALGDSELPPLPRPKLPLINPRTVGDRPEILVPREKSTLLPREIVGRYGREAVGRLSGRRFEGRMEKSGDPISVSGLLRPVDRQRLLSVEDKGSAKERNFDLAGPVARERRLLYQPSLPVISLVRDVAVDFRFWVRPDGTVSRVETLQLGNLDVVNVAERFLRQWRFSTLPAELPQVEQWGTVKLLFQVPR